MLCSYALQLWNGAVYKKMKSVLTPTDSQKKKQAEHLVMKTVTKNALQYQHIGLAELHRRVCGTMLLGNWVPPCSRLCSA